ncbi:MAG: acyl carrier protein [Candidatus Acidiferrales bacterium]
MADVVTDRVLQAIAAVKKIPRERVSAAQSLEELGVDSLDAVTMVFDLEEAFQISIPDEKVRSLRTVQDIIDGIRMLRGELAGAAPVN